MKPKRKNLNLREAECCRYCVHSDYTCDLDDIFGRIVCEFFPKIIETEICNKFEWDNKHGS